MHGCDGPSFSLPRHLAATVLDADYLAFVVGSAGIGFG